MTALSRAVSRCSASGGGITCVGSAEMMRCQASEASGLPGTMGVCSLPALSRRASRAFSGRSSRRSALLALGSWPWHLKQVFAMTGRTSRLNRTTAGSAGSVGIAAASAAVKSPATGSMPNFAKGVMREEMDPTPEEGKRRVKPDPGAGCAGAYLAPFLRSAKRAIIPGFITRSSPAARRSRSTSSRESE